MSQLIDADANWSSGTCGGTHDFEPDSASPVDLLGALVEHLAKRGIKPQLARKGTYDPSGALDAVADGVRQREPVGA